MAFSRCRRAGEHCGTHQRARSGIRIQNPLPDKAESVPASAAKGHGMAQENVRQRLHYAYRGAASLALEQPGGYYASP
ncbi:MAG: hypothetical protein R3F18_06770 [Lysobacterales bacterium]